MLWSDYSWLASTNIMKFLLLVLLNLICIYCEENEDDINYNINLITEANQKARSYQWPKDAKKYLSKGKREKFGTFDFVVIGGGAGGSVAASRLSEVEDWNVLVLEAGKVGNNLTDIPAMLPLLQLTDFNWAFNSTPQTTACQGMHNKVCFYPRGKGLGGSTLINALIYARGHQTDFDNWAELVGNERWNYKNVLNYFKKSETFVYRDSRIPYDPEFHGKEGPLRVENELPLTPQLNLFLEANKELGFDIVDHNTNKLGASPVQVCTINGRRFDNAKAFLDPVRHRRNLKILTESYVTKIRFDERKAVANGVEFSHKGKSYFVEVRKEVVLCAGVFGTPQILMLSGIGPRRHLQKLRIKVLADLEVGSTLRDHPTFWGLVVDTNSTEPTVPLKEFVRDFLHGVGPLTVPGTAQGIGMYESSYSRGSGVPDIELLFQSGSATSFQSQKIFGLSDQTFKDLHRDINPGQLLNFRVIDLHSQSVGTVKLKSRNAFDYPLINSNFLSDSGNRDIKTLYEGIQIALRLLETEAFKSVNATLKGGPLRACKEFEYLSEGYCYCALRQLSSNMFHPFGTCPMGKNPKQGAVVDSELKVFGFRNLRIADAAVFPSTFSGHPNAPVVMIGEQLAYVVKKAHNKART